MEEKREEKIVVKKPHWFYYGVTARVVKLISKLVFGLKINNKAVKKLKEPFVVIGNHAGALDIAFTVAAMVPHRLNIVMSREICSWKAIRPFVGKIAAIPFNQISTDIVGLRTIKSALEQNRNIIIYPEGKASHDGTGLHYIPINVAKLLKFLDVTVVLSYNEGAYLTKPRFFKGFRHGKTRVTESILFTREEIRSLSLEEIIERVRKALAFNDNIYQRENNIRFRTKTPAQNLSFILYKCPKCGAEYKMRSTDRLLICDACDNTVEYTEYGELIPKGDSVAYDRVDLWYAFQREAATEEVRKEDFLFTKEVELKLLKNMDESFYTAGEGVLKMDRKELVYEGTKDNAPYRLAIPMKKLHTLITKNEEGIDLVRTDGVYRFLFKDPWGSTKMCLLGEQIFALENNLIQ